MDDLTGPPRGGVAGGHASPGVLLRLQHDEVDAPSLLVDRRSALLRLLRAQSVQSPAGRNSARDRPYRLLPFHGARSVEGAVHGRQVVLVLYGHGVRRILQIE